jgi:hypothetical protein
MKFEAYNNDEDSGHGLLGCDAKWKWRQQGPLK